MEALIATTQPKTQEVTLRFVTRPQLERIQTGIDTSYDYELILNLRRAYRRAVIFSVLILALFMTAAAWTLTHGHVNDTPAAMESFR